MLLKKRIAIFLSALCLIISLFSSSVPALEPDEYGHVPEWRNFRNTETNNAVTDRPAPTSDTQTWEKWAVKVGDTYCTPPILVDGKVFSGSGTRVYALDQQTGEVLMVSETLPGDFGYTMNSPVYADGRIFIAISDSRICALNTDDLSIAWVTDNSAIAKGQTNSPISYKKIGGRGYVYTGTWASGMKGVLLCATTDDENIRYDAATGVYVKELNWVFTPAQDDAENLAENGSRAGGFYWTGAYVTEDYLATGSDNNSNTDSSAFYTLNPLTGEIIDAVYGITGAVRSTAVYSDGSLLFTTTGAMLYKVSVDPQGQLGAVSCIDLKEYGASSARSTPVVYNGRIYMGVRGKGNAYSSDGGHCFLVIKNDEQLSSRSFLYSIPVPGDPMAGALLSTCHEDEDFDGDGKADGRVYLYFTYNAPPGGIFFTYDSPTQTQSAGLTEQQSKIFIPGSGKQQYCISPVIVDEGGTLFYKNDSGYIFAVESNTAAITGIRFYDDAGNELLMNREFSTKTAEYSVNAESEASSVTVQLDMEDGVTALVDGQIYVPEGIRIPLEDSSTSIAITSDKDGKRRYYTVTVMKKSVNADLSALGSSADNSIPGPSNRNTRKITPDFHPDELTYTFDWFATGTGNTKGIIDPAVKKQMNLFVSAESPEASIRVWPGENTDNPASSMKDGSVKGYSAGGAYKYRFPVYSADVTRDSTAMIEVTAQDGKTVKRYEVTFLRRIRVADVAVSQTQAEAFIGDIVVLTALFTPETATDKTVFWSSSDENVATVDENGLVTAVGPGEAVITVRTNEEDGVKTDVCSFTVNDYSATDGKHVYFGENKIQAGCPNDTDTPVTLKSVLVADGKAGPETPAAGYTVSVVKDEEIAASAVTDEAGRVFVAADAGAINAPDDSLVTNENLLVVPQSGEYLLTVTAGPGDEAYEATRARLTYTAHEMNEEISVWPSCEEGGISTSSCIRYGCGYTKTERLAPEGHSLIYIPAAGEDDDQADVSEPDCRNNIHIAYYYCELCAESFLDAEGNERIEDPEGHVWGEWFVAAESTCTENGTEQRVCERDETHTQTRIIHPKGHSFGEWEVKEKAACETAGIQIRYCENDRAHTQTREIPAQGHELIEVPAVPCSCETNGNIAYYTCEKCGKAFYDEKGILEVTDPEKLILPATGHRPVHMERAEPTLEKTGNIEYYYCPDCGRCFTDKACRNEISREDTVIDSLIDIGTASVSAIPDETYNGQEHEPVPEVFVGGLALTEGLDYRLSYKNNVNAGTATVIIEGIGKYALKRTATFTINKAAQSINLNLSASSVTAGKTVTATVSGSQGNVSWRVSDTAVAKETSRGKFKALKPGSVLITATAATTANYAPATAAAELKVVPAAVKDLALTNTAKGIKITWKRSTGAAGYYIYCNGKKVKTIKKALNYTYTSVSNTKKYTIKVVPFADTGSGPAKSASAYFVSQGKISSVKTTSAGKAVVKWKKTAGASGYEIQYSTGKTFKSGVKEITVKGNKTFKKTITGLKSGKTYYFRLRAYKKAGGKTYYSAWSSTKKV